MFKNSFGQLFRVTTFGESHGPAMGVVVDGCPAGVRFEPEILNRELARRRPGQSQITTARNESDEPEILSGLHQGVTLGTPITMLVRNRDQRPEDYRAVLSTPRAGHADDVWETKFGVQQPSGGGRASGRETVSRVMAGAVAQMFIRQSLPEYRLVGFVSQIGPISMQPTEFVALDPAVLERNVLQGLENSTRLPVAHLHEEAEALLLKAVLDGESYGGRAHVWVDGLPAGLGQPVFHKLKADLGFAAMSIGASHVFGIGDSDQMRGVLGSEFHGAAPYGGDRGGISTGDRLEISVGFKPSSSILDVAKRGRHDPCIVPRALPVLEAMVHLVLADHLLWSRTDRLLE